LKSLVYTILLSFFVSPAGQAQVSPHYEQPIATPLRIVSLPDSVIHVFNEDSLIMKTMSNADTVQRPGKSTTVAFVASMIVPGAGQIYNGSYWKAPIIWGVGYYFFSVYNQQNKLYGQYSREYAASIDSNNTRGDLSVRDNRNFYHKQRDTFGWYIAITYVINLIDAYVDASLYNFEVSPNLQPTSELRASVRIPL
jgi:hypothetical protein